MVKYWVDFNQQVHQFLSTLCSMTYSPCINIIAVLFFFFFFFIIMLTIIIMILLLFVLFNTQQYIYCDNLVSTRNILANYFFLFFLYYKPGKKKKHPRSKELSKIPRKSRRDRYIISFKEKPQTLVLHLHRYFKMYTMFLTLKAARKILKQTTVYFCFLFFRENNT